SVADLRRPPESDLLQLALAECDELGIGQDPQRVMLLAEVLEAEARLARLRHHVGAPAPEILNPPDLHFWRVHVDPVVGEGSGALHDQAYDEKVPIGEA